MRITDLSLLLFSFLFAKYMRRTTRFQAPKSKQKVCTDSYKR